MEIITLTKDELKKIKRDFFNGGVYTDGCFCGSALGEIKEKLYVALDFSCRKSMSCEGSYYQVNDVKILKKGTDIYTNEQLEFILEGIKNKTIDVEVYKIDGYSIYLNCDFYNESIDDIYLIAPDAKLEAKSLKMVQKRLFKYYLDTYGQFTDVKFSDIKQFNWIDN